MNVVVAGGTGGIGRAVCDHLARSGHAVFPLASSTLDLRTDLVGARQFLKTVQPDAIVHLAGRKPPADPEQMLATNPAITLCLLEAARTVAPAARHVLASSAAVYGEPPSAYGISKRISESLAFDYASRYRASIIVARFFNVTNVWNDRTSVIPELVSRLRGHGEGPFLVRDRSAVRDFIDATDVARAIEAAVVREVCPAVFDVGTGTGVTIGEVAAIARDVVRPGLTLRDAPAQTGAIATSVADLTGLRALNALPLISSREAVLRSVRRYVEGTGAGGVADART